MSPASLQTLLHYYDCLYWVRGNKKERRNIFSIRLKEIQTHQVRIGWRFSNMCAICLVCCVCAVSLVYCLCTVCTSVRVLKLCRVCLLAVCYPSCVVSVCCDVLSVYCLCAVGPYFFCVLFIFHMLSVCCPFRELSVHTVRPSFLRPPSMCVLCAVSPCVFCALSVHMLSVRCSSICYLCTVHPCVICALSVVLCFVCPWVVCIPPVRLLCVCHACMTCLFDMRHAYVQSVCHAYVLSVCVAYLWCNVYLPLMSYLCAVHTCDDCVESFSYVVCVQSVSMLVLYRPPECWLSFLCFLCAVRSCVVRFVCSLLCYAFCLCVSFAPSVRVLSVRFPSITVCLPSHLLPLCSLLMSVRVLYNYCLSSCVLTVCRPSLWCICTVRPCVVSLSFVQCVGCLPYVRVLPFVPLFSVCCSVVCCPFSLLFVSCIVCCMYAVLLCWLSAARPCVICALSVCCLPSDVLS